MSLTLATPPVLGVADATFTIPGLSWEQYIAINDALGDRAGLRTLYLDGRMTFLSPARRHEWFEDALDKILLAICLGCEIEIDAVSSTTLRIKGQQGLEGDRSYYLRDHALLMRGPVEIDLTIHPPPDLAIEVENTHRATDAVAIYASLGVPEVWRHDVRRQTLTFHHLQPNGTYLSVAQSLAFPFLTPADVLGQVQQAEANPSGIRWFRQLTDWVRDEIRPRLDPA